MKGPTRDSRTDGLPDWARWRADTLVLALHVQPGARRTAFVGTHGGRLKIALQAPPVDGKANAALVGHLAAALGVRQATVRVSAGAASREKSVAIDCDAAAAQALVACLLALLPGGD